MSQPKLPVTAHNAIWEITEQDRLQMIATNAYFRAQQRNFAPGHEAEDWLQAEIEVNEHLGVCRNC